MNEQDKFDQYTYEVEVALQQFWHCYWIFAAVVIVYETETRNVA